MDGFVRLSGMVRILILCSAVLSGCVSFSPRDPSPVPLAPNVDLPRFMGDWYVIAHIATDYDRGSHSAVENYRLNDDGSIATTYTNRLGGFDGKPKTLTPTMHVQPDSGNALWGVRFFWWWPFLYEYRLAHLEPDYSAAIVARSDLDFLWIFSRTPRMSEVQYERYVKLIAGWGYDVTKLEKVPHR